MEGPCPLPVLFTSSFFYLMGYSGDAGISDIEGFCWNFACHYARIDGILLGILYVMRGLMNVLYVWRSILGAHPDMRSRRKDRRLSLARSKVMSSSRISLVPHISSKS